MVYVGFDWRITSPAVAVVNGSDIHWWCLAPIKSFVPVTPLRVRDLTFHLDWIPVDEQPDRSSEDWLPHALYCANTALDWIDSVLPPGPVSYAIEDYAMGAAGRITAIVEHTALLKYAFACKHPKVKLHLVAPTRVKKLATGKGNADKPQMAAAFTSRTDVNVHQWLCGGKGKLRAPSTDLIDAYFVATRQTLVQ